MVMHSISSAQMAMKLPGRKSHSAISLMMLPPSGWSMAASCSHQNIKTPGGHAAHFFLTIKTFLMKAIKIKKELKNHFLQSAEHFNLKVVQLKTIAEEGHLFFRIEGHVSQNDIFKLGYLFSKLIQKKTSS